MDDELPWPLTSRRRVTRPAVWVTGGITTGIALVYLLRGIGEHPTGWYVALGAVVLLGALTSLNTFLAWRRLRGEGASRE